MTPMGVGYPDTPGIWSDEQVEGWQLVTKGVHSGGGRIVLQLWHVGRISDPAYLHGKLPVAPSAIAPEGYVNLLRPKKNFVAPRALELDEIPEVIESYRVGTLTIVTFYLITQMVAAGGLRMFSASVRLTVESTVSE